MKEQVGDADGRFHQPALALAQVEDQSAQASAHEVRESQVDLADRVLGEARDPDVTDAEPRIEEVVGSPVSIPPHAADARERDGPATDAD